MIESRLDNVALDLMLMFTCMLALGITVPNLERQVAL